MTTRCYCNNNDVDDKPVGIVNMMIAKQIVLVQLPLLLQQNYSAVVYLTIELVLLLL